MRYAAPITVLLLACGCGSGGGGEAIDAGRAGDAPQAGDGGNSACIEGLETLAITPGSQTVTVDAGAPQDIVLTAEGTFAGGDERAIDGERLRWEVSRDDDTPPGTITAGVLSPNPGTGGELTVTATDGCARAEATVTLVLDAVVGMTQSPADWEGQPVTDGAPAIVYPSAETLFPRNIYGTLFQWTAAGASEFRLTFTGPGSHVVVYTDGVHPDCAGAAGAGCWEAEQQAWTFIAASNAGETVTVTVDALDRTTTPPTVRRSAPIDIEFSRRDVDGAIFYWSTTSAGVRRAYIEDNEPDDYIAGKPPTTYTNPDDAVKCVACHVVSRDGKYMVAPVDATSGQSLWIMQVTKDAPPDPLIKVVDETRGHGFATISPDDTYVAAAWKGAMWVVDRESGTFIEDIPLGGLDGTQPDWSPTNAELVFATGDGDAPADASIATISFGGIGTWGTPKTIVAAAGGSTNLFPMFSPEGDWVAFARGDKGGHNDLSTQLFVVPSTGGDAVELVRANRVVSNQMTDGLHENSMPTWAPPGDLQWIAFNSERAYGVVLADGEQQQIWVAAVDLSGTSSGQDPSYPAFRLQFQGLHEDNHRAYWTLDIRHPSPE